MKYKNNPNNKTGISNRLLKKKLDDNFKAANIDDVIRGSNNGTLKSDQVREVKLDNILVQCTPNKNMDFIFLEFYIKKKFNQKVEEYFNVGRQSVSDWRISNTIPEKRLLQFQVKEGSIDPKELFKKLYN